MAVVFRRFLSVAVPVFLALFGVLFLWTILHYYFEYLDYIYNLNDIPYDQAAMVVQSVVRDKLLSSGLYYTSAETLTDLVGLSIREARSMHPLVLAALRLLNKPYSRVRSMGLAVSLPCLVLLITKELGGADRSEPPA
jgi:hypothetical protein